VYHDVTERRQNERLAEFANIVSHDLRNPLNVAKGHLDLLERESTPGTLPARTARVRPPNRQRNRRDPRLVDRGHRE
jgi:signal transduction histidine kinase